MQHFTYYIFSTFIVVFLHGQHRNIKKMWANYICLLFYDERLPWFGVAISTNYILSSNTIEWGKRE